jgi:predicted dehydrogenase
LNGAGERDDFCKFSLIGGRSVGATSNGNGAANAAPRDAYNGSGSNGNGAHTNGIHANGAHGTNGLHQAIHKNGFSAAPKDRTTEVAVVGYGNWGSKHVRVFSSMPDVKVTVVDRDPLRLAEAQRTHPMVRLDEDLHRALETADAVVIATPPASHAPIAHAAIRAGRHVLVEKPLATSVDDCEDLIAAARHNGVHLMVGHTFEHDAAIWKLREIANSGILGEIRYIDSARLNLGLYQDDVNVVWDLAPHDVSIINFILGGPPTAVSAWGHCHANHKYEDVAHLKLRYAELDVFAYIHVSWLDPCKVRRITIVGSEKMAVYNDMATEGKIRIYDVGVDNADLYPEPVKYRRGDTVAPAINCHEPLAEQAKQLLKCVRTGEAPTTNGQSGLAVARVLEAADRAMRAGVEVPLHPEPVIDISIEPITLTEVPAVVLDQATA